MHVGVSPPETSCLNQIPPQSQEQTLQVGWSTTWRKARRPTCGRDLQIQVLSPAHVVCTWPPVTPAAKTSICNWEKLVRFFRLRGSRIKHWKGGPWVCGVWPEAHSSPSPEQISSRHTDVTEENSWGSAKHLLINCLHIVSFPAGGPILYSDIIFLKLNKRKPRMAFIHTNWLGGHSWLHKLKDTSLIISSK